MSILRVKKYVILIYLYTIYKSLCRKQTMISKENVVMNSDFNYKSYNYLHEQTVSIY